jgi:hypothetical protein
MEPAMGSVLRSTGDLRKRYLPAVYLDPSFFARYSVAAIAASQPAAAALAARVAARLPPLADEEETAFATLAERLAAGGFPLTAVLAPFTLLRWMQTVAPLFREEEPGWRQAASREESDFAGLRFQSWLNRLLGDALAGLVQVDLVAFELRRDAVWEETTAAALQDSDERCTLHALAARHLGATWVATLRPEMARILELLAGAPRPLLGARAVLGTASAAPPTRS